MQRIVSSALLCGLVLVNWTSAVAQTTTAAPPQAITEFAQLGTRLETGNRVKVNRGDQTFEGPLVGLEPTALRIRFNGEVLSIPADQVRSVAHLRSKAGSGAALGVMIGAGSVLTMALIARARAEDGGEFDLSGGELAAATALYGGIGGAAGAIIGRMLDKSETIYVAAPGKIPGAPSSHGAAVMFLVRF